MQKLNLIQHFNLAYTDTEDYYQELCKKAEDLKSRSSTVEPQNLLSAVTTLRSHLEEGRPREVNMQMAGKSLLEVDPTQKTNCKDKRSKIKALKSLLDSTINAIYNEANSRQEEIDSSVQVDTLSGDHDASVQVETLEFITQQATSSLAAAAPTISIGSAEDETTTPLLTREDIYLQELTKAIQDSRQSVKVLEDILARDPKSTSYDSVVSTLSL